MNLNMDGNGSIGHGTLLLVTVDKDQNKIYLKLVKPMKIMMFKISNRDKELLDAKVFDAEGMETGDIITKVSANLVSAGAKCIVDQIRQIIAGAIV